jgi:predicted aminopeptidase
MERRAAGERIDTELDRYRRRLAKLYDEPHPPATMRREKSAILRALCTAVGRGAVEDCSINNATLALHRSYAGGHCAFARLYAETGRDIRRFHAESRAISRWPAADRAAWLDRSCHAVARNEEL